MNSNLRIPAFVNYDCQLCGWCCHQYDITFSTADYERLSKFEWGKLEPEKLGGKEWAAPLRDSSTPDQYRLRYAPDGACVFLNGKYCLMHKHVGELGKTLGCCVYPFTFAGTPTGVYVGCRFSCKAMAYGLGEPIQRRREFLAKQLALCAASRHVPRYGDTVVFEGRKTLPWSDYLAFEESLIRIFLRDDLPLARRLFMAHKMADVLRQAKLERVRGDKFKELIAILETGLAGEAESEPLPGQAGRLQRMLFRQFCFLFQRRYGGSYRELGFFGKLGARLRSFQTGAQFTFAAGAARLIAMDGLVPLRKVERMAPQPLDSADELAISRFLAAKLYGKQHFGKLFFGYPLLPGLEFLFLSAGAVMWYARARALARGDSATTSEDVHEAIRYVDFCYGYSRAPALALERMRVRILSHADSAIRLAVAQYG